MNVKYLSILLALLVLGLPLAAAQDATTQATVEKTEVKETGVANAVEEGKAPVKSSREEQLQKILERKGIKNLVRKDIRSIQKATKASVKQSKDATKDKLADLKASGASKGEIKDAKAEGKKEVKDLKTGAKEKAKQLWTSAKDRLRNLFSSKKQ